MVMVAVICCCSLFFQPWLEKCSEPCRKSGEGLDYWIPKITQQD